MTTRIGSAQRLAAAAMVIAATSHASSRPAAGRPLPLENPAIVAVYSGTDRDAQLFISTGSTVPMADIAVTSPRGTRVASTTFGDHLGQADVRFETPEPTLAKLKRTYPAGIYRWSGHTVDGRRLTGRSRLSYQLLTPPTITAPASASTIPSTGAVARWHPVSGAKGIHLELEQIETNRLLTMDLDGNSTSFAIPDGFMKSRLEYTLDVQAVGAYRQPHGRRRDLQDRLTLAARPQRMSGSRSDAAGVPRPIPRTRSGGGSRSVARDRTSRVVPGSPSSTTGMSRAIANRRRRGSSSGWSSRMRARDPPRARRADRGGG